MKWIELKKVGAWTFFFGLIILFLNIAWVFSINGCGGNEFNETLGVTDPCGSKTGIVVRVLDGDTVELKDGRKIRYLHVDTPEISRSENKESDCFGDEAKKLNTELVLNKTVDLEYDLNCYDMFSRTLAFLSIDGRMINKVLIERGYGELMIILPNNKYEEEFEVLEEEARENRAGIWGLCQ